MPRRPSFGRRLSTAARWPVGVALTSWAYMWRTTPLHRREEIGDPRTDAPPPLPANVSREDVQWIDDGAGPLFHRRYRIAVHDARLTPEELFDCLTSDPNRASPTEFATFNKVHGGEGGMTVGDEYVVRMPGPWDGPVRVVDVRPASFRLVTLDGHLEAGEIEFRARTEDDRLVFEIESWARSGDRLSNLLYARLRMAKEIQLHMWTSFLERVAKAAGGRMTGGVDIATRRLEAGGERA